MKRAVIDTTVLISAFLTEEGVSAKLLEEARGGAFVAKHVTVNPVSFAPAGYHYTSRPTGYHHGEMRSSAPA